MTRNLLDKAIGYLAPRTALRRVQARAALELLSAYEGASRDRRLANWQARGTSANAANQNDFVVLRDRAFDLVRNSPYAGRGASMFAGHAVGTGITRRTSDVKANELFKNWVEYCDADGRHDWYGLQRLIARSVFVGGEALIRKRIRRVTDGFEVPLQLQVLEGHFLDHQRISLDPKSPKGNYIIQGIEFDSLGRRAAYYLWNQHPGEMLQIRSTLESRRVPADEVIHVYVVDRPGQVRGVTHLAPVVADFKHLSDYEDATIIRKKVEACIAAVIRQPDDGDGAGIKSKGPDGKIFEEFSPGMVARLNLGEDISFLDPRPSAGEKEFKTGKLRDLAIGTGLMYEQLSGDLSLVNYSSYCAGQIDFRTVMDQFRWFTMVFGACQPMSKWFMETAFLAGKIGEMKAVVEYGVTLYKSVDPEKDATADLLELRIGGKTWPQLVAERGLDPKAQLDEMKEHAKSLDKAGLILDSDPRNTARNGAARATAPATTQEATQ